MKLIKTYNPKRNGGKFEKKSFSFRKKSFGSETDTKIDPWFRFLILSEYNVMMLTKVMAKPIMTNGLCCCPAQQWLLFLVKLQRLLLRLSQSCSVSKETVDITATRGTLWSNNLLKSANIIILSRTKASLW